VGNSSCVRCCIEAIDSDFASSRTFLKSPGYVLVSSKSETAELALATDAQHLGRGRNLDSKGRNLDKTSSSDFGVGLARGNDMEGSRQGRSGVEAVAVNSASGRTLKNAPEDRHVGPKLHGRALPNLAYAVRGDYYTGGGIG
jgi:hypothetical protein